MEIITLLLLRDCCHVSYFFVFVLCLFNICFMFVLYLNAIPILLDMEINMLLLFGSWFHVSYRASDLTLCITTVRLFLSTVLVFLTQNIFTEAAFDFVHCLVFSVVV